MLKNILIIVVLISSLSGKVSNSSIYSKNFCKLEAEKECAQRNAPHIYQCGPGICASSETECREYLRVEKKIKFKGLLNVINVINSRTHFINLKLRENFNLLKDSIKNCTQTRNEWQPSQVCHRGRDCIQKKLNFIGVFIHTTKVNCPCIQNKPYVCGSQKKFCTINKEACDSFINIADKSPNFTAWTQSLSIKKC